MTRARTAALAAIAGAAIVVVAVVAWSGSSSHRLRAAFTEATNVIPGEQVRIAGRKVGRVASVAARDGDAVVTMDIDDSAWPLHVGTTARIRFGTTISVAARYVELQPGPRTARSIPDGGVLSEDDTITPVEFDQLFNTFDAPTRSNLRDTVARGADGLVGEQRDLQKSIPRLAGTYGAVGNVLRGLGADPSQLQQLVTSLHATTAALAQHDADLQSVLERGGQTFTALADESQAITRSLDLAPSTLRSTRVALDRAAPSLTGLQTTLTDLKPGAARLPSSANRVRTAVGVLSNVAPLATQTLGRAARAAPDISSFLGAGTPFSDLTAQTLQSAVPVLSCVRPYAPDVAGLLSTWAGFAKNYDEQGHYIRMHPLVRPYNDTVPLAPKDLAGLPGFQYAYPRPPGYGIGQSWFQPDCGVGSDVLNAAKDAEAKGP